MHLVRTAALVAFVGLAACAQQDAVQAPTQEQGIRLETVTVETARGPVRFQVEIADTEEERNRGLMFRREMAADRGMLFEFQDVQRVSFWMRNTHLSLDLIFIGADGRVINIAEHATPYTDTPIPSAGPVRGVLEINAGLARQHGIAPGDRVRHRIFPN